MPHSRRDLAIGTFVGRTVIVVVPTVVALLVAGVIGMVKFGTDGALLFPWFLVVTSLFAATFVAIGVGISMVSTDDRRLTLVALGTYVLLVNFYDSLHSLTLLFLHRGQTEVLTALPDWALLYRLFQPSEAYFRLLRLGFEINRADQYLAREAPFYVDWWMGLVVLTVYCVCSLSLGYRRFRTGDL
jgi:ABC-2 type transport system permease protein